MTSDSQDRIERIRALEGSADKSEQEISVERWESACLIWEEVNAGLSRRELAERVGKSHTHINFMYRCWELVGRKLGFREGSDLSGLPAFGEIYRSDEVRGKSDQQDRRMPPEPDEQTERPRRVAEDDGPSEYSAAGLITTARRALDTLIDNRAYWQVVDRDLLGAIEGIERKASSLRADIIRSQTG